MIWELFLSECSFSVLGCVRTTTDYADMRPDKEWKIIVWGPIRTFFGDILKINILLGPTQILETLFIFYYVRPICVIFRTQNWGTWQGFEVSRTLSIYLFSSIRTSSSYLDVITVTQRNTYRFLLRNTYLISVEIKE